MEFDKTMYFKVEKDKQADAKQILKEVYDEAYKIYDFRNSGKKDYSQNVALIKKLDKEFCQPRKKKRPIF